MHRAESRTALRVAFAVLAAIAGLSACGSAPEGRETEATTGASVAGSDQPAIAGELPPVEGDRKVLVVHFPQGSATRHVAEDLAYLLGADLEKEAGRAPFAGASFVEKDFRTENRAAYVAAVGELAARFR